MGIFQCCFAPKVETPGADSSHGIVTSPSSGLEPAVRAPLVEDVRVSTPACAKVASDKLHKLATEKEWQESARCTAKDSGTGLECALSLQAKLCAAGTAHPFPEARAGFLAEVIQKHLGASAVRLYVMASGFMAESSTRPVDVVLVQLAQALMRGSAGAGRDAFNGCRAQSGACDPSAATCEYLCPIHEPVGSSSALLRQALISKMPVVLKRMGRRSPMDEPAVTGSVGATSSVAAAMPNSRPQPCTSPTLGGSLARQFVQAAVQSGSSACSSLGGAVDRLADPAAAAAAAAAASASIAAGALDPQCCPDLDLTESDAVPNSAMIFAAVPLVYGMVTIGVLWIALPTTDDDVAAGQLTTCISNTATSGDLTVPQLSRFAGGVGAAAGANPASISASAAGSLVNAASLSAATSGPAALLSNVAAMEHVAMSVAMHLAAGCTDATQLCRLAECLHDLADSATLAELVVELCNTLVQQVRQRFFVDATAHAALVPAPDSKVAFMLKPDRVEGPGSARANRQQMTPSRLRLASVPSVPSSTGFLTNLPGAEGNRSRSNASAAMAAGSMSRRGTNVSGSLPAAASASAAAAAANGSTVKQAPELQRAYSIAVAAESHASGVARASSLSVLRASVPRDVFMLESSVVRSDGSFGMLSTCAGGAGGAGVAPPALSARAFRLSNTLLQAMIQAAQAQQHQPQGQQPQQPQQQGRNQSGSVPRAGAGHNSGSRVPSAAPVVADRLKMAPHSFDSRAGDASSGGPTGAFGGGVLLGRCVRDCARHVQDERQPSRDVCMLMMAGGGGGRSDPAGESRTGGGGGASGSARGAAAEQGSMGPPTGTSGCGGGGGGAQSLVLLGMETGDGAVLAVYLAFPTPAPAKLLEAVREACSVLMREHLANLVRHRLRCSDLAAEWETLRAGVPGSYLSVSRCSVVPPDTHGGGAGALSYTHSHLPSVPGGRRGAPPPFLLMSAGSNVVQGPPHGAPLVPVSAIDDGGFLHGALSSMRGRPTSPSRTAQGSVPGTHGPLAVSDASLVSLAPGMAGQHRVSQSPQPSQTGMLFSGGCADASAASAAAAGSMVARKPSLTHHGADDGLTLGGPSWLRRTRRSISAVPLGTGASQNRSGSGARGFLRVFSGKNNDMGGAPGSSAAHRSPLNSGCHGVASRVGAAGDGAVSPVGTATTEPDEDEHAAWALSTAPPATPPAPGGGLAAAGMLTVHDLDETYESWGMRAHMGALVDSIISTTLRSSGTHLRPDEGGAGAELAVARVTEGLEELQLSAVLGQGASGVVLKGTLGCTPVAVKIMEMPDGDASIGPGAADAAGGAAGGQAAGPSSEDDEADGGGGGGGVGSQSDKPVAEPREVRARRALLRNAMEVALMRSISHVNIVQAFAVYDNVIMERHEGRQGIISLRRINQKDASEHKLPDGGAAGALRSSPICTAIVLELCDRGSLADVLHNRSFPALPLPPPHPSASPAATAGAAMQYARYWKGVYMTLLEIALALRHLHSRRLVHRDLKPGNILLKSSPGDPRGWTCKLADFGFSVVLDRLEQPQGAEDAPSPSRGMPALSGPAGLGSSSSSSLATALQLPNVNQQMPPPTTVNGGTSPGPREWYTIQQQIGGTVTHMAPEAFKKGSRIDATVDVFSFGVIMWELVCGRGHRPHRDLTLDSIGDAVSGGTRPMFPPGDHVPLSYRQLARSCWSAEPRMRPSSAELVVIVKGFLESLRA